MHIGKMLSANIVIRQVSEHSDPLLVFLRYFLLTPFSFGSEYQYQCKKLNLNQLNNLCLGDFACT
jgi:hypothetical protein